MADAHHLSINKVELLTRSNYYVWELKVSAILRNKGLFKPVIEDPEPPSGEEPSTPEAKLREAWEVKNDKAISIINVTLSTEQAGLFIGARSAKKVWEDLRRIHAGNVEDRKIDIALELRNLKMDQSETVDG